MLLELLVGVIIVGAFFGQSVFGFGGGVVAVPLLGLILDIKSAISLALIFQFLIGLLIFANYRTIPWRRMPILIGAVAVRHAEHLPPHACGYNHSTHKD